MFNKARKDNCQELANFMANTLATNNTLVWRNPYLFKGGIVSHATGKPYTFFHTLIIALTKGNCGEYATFNQIKKAGGHVKKGARSVTLYSWRQRKEKPRVSDVDDDETISADNTRGSGMFCASWHLFDISTDCEGVKPKYLKDIRNTENKNIADVDKFIADFCEREGIKIVQEDISCGWYSANRDVINIPPIDRFISATEYYGCIFHELGHATRHEKRLNRTYTDVKGRAREEGVAEICSSFCMQYFGLATDEYMKNAGAYIKNWGDVDKMMSSREKDGKNWTVDDWISNIRDDKNFTMTVFGRAQRAAEYILGITYDNTEREEE